MDLAYKYRLIILCLIAFVSTWIVFKPILKIAKEKNIVDNPDARKLQKTPIPVMGGIAVFFGIIVALSFYKTMISYTVLFPVISAMAIMLYLGAIDDVISTKAGTRFVLEAFVSLLVIYGLKVYISDFQGLWGIKYLPSAVGIPLSVIAFIGIINAVNMIDGVDGLSSAFCIMICGCFGIFCFCAHLYSFSVLAAAAIGALIPFFLHNVFGYTTKMFIGDSGTMMIGTALASMVLVILKEDFPIDRTLPQIDFSRIAFCLAVMSIPISDTLRVMVHRIIRHCSPFSPDKNHLHHLFNEVGVSYIWTTICEITLNIIVIAVFLLVWRLGASIDMQVYTVILAAAAADIGTAILLKRISQSRSRAADTARKLANKSHIERIGLWRKIQRLIDGE